MSSPGTLRLAAGGWRLAAKPHTLISTTTPADGASWKLRVICDTGVSVIMICPRQRVADVTEEEASYVNVTHQGCRDLRSTQKGQERRLNCPIYSLSLIAAYVRRIAAL